MALTSSPGAGTTVTIHLPAEAATTVSARQRAVGSDRLPVQATRTGSILVVDDEAAVREAYAEALAVGDTTTAACATADEAWQRFAAAPEAVDVVVIDQEPARSTRT